MSVTTPQDGPWTQASLPGRPAPNGAVSDRRTGKGAGAVPATGNRPGDAPRHDPRPPAANTPPSPAAPATSPGTVPASPAPGPALPTTPPGPTPPLTSTTTPRPQQTPLPPSPFTPRQAAYPPPQQAPRRGPRPQPAPGHAPLAAPPPGADPTGPTGPTGSAGHTSPSNAAGAVPPGGPWLDEAAGHLVRPYTVSNGRTRPVMALDLLSHVLATGSAPVGYTAPEHLRVLELCRVPVSVAEIAGQLRLPVAVTKVLLGDLLDCAALTVQAPAYYDDPTDRSLLEAVLHGLRRQL